MSYCSACGTKQSPGATFCPNCGNAVATSIATAEPPAPAAPRPFAEPSRVPPPVAPPSVSGGFGTPVASPFAAPQASTTAVISLVTGIAAYVVLPVIGAIIAIIAGHMARKEIRESQGRLTGDGMALAGLILGYIHLVAGFCIVGIFVFGILAAIGAGR